MPIVSDILNLAPFREGRLICGASGLANPVKHVSVYDSSPEQSDDLTNESGGFYITGYYFLKDNPETARAYFSNLRSYAACGLCIIDEYISDLPDELKAFCDEHRLPVIIVSKLITYSEMITSIMELIILSQQAQLTENKLASLASGHLDYRQKQNILQELNLHLKEYLSVLFCAASKDEPDFSQREKQDLLAIINRDVFSFAAAYQNGLLIIYSYGEKDVARLDSRLQYLTDKIRERLPRAIIGISRSCLLEQCDQANSQAVTGVNVYPLKRGEQVFFTSLGVYRLLSALLGHQELESFYHDTFDPIWAYDRDHSTTLFDTMTAFFQCNCSYAETGKQLYLHENTIRYRLEKIKELLHIATSDSEFQHTLATALKIHQMKQLTR